MHPFTLVFLITLVASTAVKVWLDRRQIEAVRANRDNVPAPFGETITIDNHRKAADYTEARTRLGILDTVIDALLLVGWTLGGGLALLDAVWAGADLGPLLTGVAVIVSAMLIMSLLSLPLGIYRTFNIEARFGFNKTTPALYIADLFKGMAVTLVLGVPLVAVILWLMARSGELWWLYAWAVWTGFSLIMTWAYPTLIAPLFNRFSPLADDGLKTRIEELLTRCGFRSNGIFVMDGSRRSTHGNAYFTGVGANKRIVFFDTLIETLDHNEVEAVLAHELGHFRKNHVKKRLSVMFVTSLGALALLGWLAANAWFYGALGVEVASNHMALLLFLMVSGVFTYWFTPLASWMSRRHEYEADEYAAEQSDAGALTDALVKMYRDNATTLTPDPIHSGFYDSHPPAPKRVARLTALAAG